MNRPIEGSVHAWDILESNFIDNKGVIERKDKSHKPTQRECDAIDHLCAEWDYAWEGSNENNYPICEGAGNV